MYALYKKQEKPRVSTAQSRAHAKRKRLFNGLRR